MEARLFRMLGWLWVALLVVLVVVARVADAADGWPVAGSILVLGVGLLALLVIGWLRQRPIAPGDDSAFQSTVLMKFALVEGVGLIGFGLAITAGPWWLAALGAALSLVGLWLSWPSEADRERHELLYLV